MYLVTVYLINGSVITKLSEHVVNGFDETSAASAVLSPSIMYGQVMKTAQRLFY